MTRHASVLGAAALFLGIAALPATAFQLNVGGLGLNVNIDQGVAASVGSDEATLGVSLGGNAIASAGAEVGASAVSAAATGDGGDVLLLDQSEGATGVTVNLGLDGLLGGGPSAPPNDDPPLVPGPDDPAAPFGAGPSSIGPAGPGALTLVASTLGSMSADEQEMVLGSCARVIAWPTYYDRGLFILCQLINQIGR